MLGEQRGNAPIDRAHRTVEEVSHLSPQGDASVDDHTYAVNILEPEEHLLHIQELMSSLYHALSPVHAYIAKPHMHFTLAEHDQYL